jgi:hypothetical protein
LDYYCRVQLAAEFSADPSFTYFWSLSTPLKFIIALLLAKYPRYSISVPLKIHVSKTGCLKRIKYEITVRITNAGNRVLVAVHSCFKNECALVHQPMFRLQLLMNPFHTEKISS